MDNFRASVVYPPTSAQVTFRPNAQHRCISHDTKGNIWAGDITGLYAFDRIHILQKKYLEDANVKSIACSSGRVYIAYSEPRGSSASCTKRQGSILLKRLGDEHIICSFGGVRKMTAAGDRLVILMDTQNQLCIIDSTSMAKESVDFADRGTAEDVKFLTASSLLILTNRRLVSYDIDRKSTRLNSSHVRTSRMPSSA